MRNPFNSNQRFIISEYKKPSQSLNEVIFAVDKFISASSKFSKNNSSTFIFNDTSKTLIGRSVVGLDDIHEPFSIMDFGAQPATEINLNDEQVSDFFKDELGIFFKKLIHNNKIGTQLCCLEMTISSIDDEYRPKLRLFKFENPWFYVRLSKMG